MRLNPKLINRLWLFGCCLLITGALGCASGTAATGDQGRANSDDPPPWSGYDPPAMSINVPTDRAVAAIEKHARKAGWKILEANPRIGIVEAISHVFEENGKPARERWSFLVAPDSIRVWRYVEIASDRHPAAIWTRRYDKLTTNNYWAEREHLTAIAAELGSKPRLVAATR